MKPGCLLLALVALLLAAPAIDGAIRTIGQGIADGVLIVSVGVALTLPLLAGGAVWALKPQPTRPVVLFDNRTVVLVEGREQQALGTVVNVLEGEWVEL
jgi:hypothetical protein